MRHASLTAPLSQTVRGDFDVLQPLARAALPHWNWKGIFSELHAQMREECDFSIEAREQTWFHTFFAGDPDIEIPRVHVGCCTAGVLDGERRLTMKTIGALEEHWHDRYWKPLRAYLNAAR